MSDWKGYRLDEVAEIKNGKSRPKGTGSIPVYGGNGILGHSDKSNVQDETIIIGRVGAYCGAVYYEDKPVWISDNALYAKANPGFNAKFLYYLLRNDNLNQYAGGSSHPLLTQGRLNELKYHIPDSTTQNAIAEILSSLDDKIELNNKINQELEALAQALFKRWFVDFEFPDEKGQPYKSSGGEMVESELGEVPKGWSVSEFSSHVESSRGLSYKGQGLANATSGVPMVNLNSVYEGGGYKYEGIKYYSGDYKERHIIQPWDLAVANTEQGHKYLLIGYPAFVPKQIGEQGIFSHHIYRVRTRKESPLTNHFFYYLMLQPSIREQIIGACNGTTVNMLKIDGLQRPKFIQPSKQVVKDFSSTASYIWEYKENLYAETQELINLRDTLLPKLISGELKISNEVAENVM